MQSRATWLSLSIAAALLAGCGSGSECPAGTQLCGSLCVTLSHDNVNCGACGQVCGAESFCSAGACTLACPGKVGCGGGCIDPQSDATYCGASGNCSGASAGVACAAGLSCVAGACKLVCPAGQLACAGRCVDPQTDAGYCGATGGCAGANAGAVCTSPLSCRAGACSCPAGQLLCDGACVDPKIDPVWCGASGDCAGAHRGAICPAAETCLGGACSCPASGLILCGSSCVNPASDSNWCGATTDCSGLHVGVQCAIGKVCAGGQCTCPTGQISCGGACVNPRTDSTYCGATSTGSDSCSGAQACTGGQSCSNGSCACPAGQAFCSGACVDPLTSGAHCGASLAACAGGQVCGGGQSCVAGQCKLQCPAGQLACGGACVDPASSVGFCGARLDCAGGNAGAHCATGQGCTGGACACPAGQLVCNGACVNPASDPLHCGASLDCSAGHQGIQCSGGQVCSNGACALTCQSGLVACSGACVNPMTDAAHCGASASCSGGVACGGGQVCSSGACSCPADKPVLCDGVCVDGASNASYCGASGSCTGALRGAACLASQSCAGGLCSCPAGQVACNGACVDGQSNASWCGARLDCFAGNVGRACLAGQSCAAGSCRCPGGQVECGGACIDPATDPAWCGATSTCAGANQGAACLPTQSCTAGRCSCPPGQLLCNGGCVDPLTDPTWCGATSTCAGANQGSTCAAGSICSNGSCGCPIGQLFCNGACQALVPLDLDTPFATSTPPFATVVNPEYLPVSANWASVAPPLPTNATWETFAIDGGGGSRADFLPYQVKAGPSWLYIQDGVTSSTASDQVTVPDVAANQLLVGVSQGSFLGHVVRSWDLLSVTLRFTAAGGTMTAPLVYGSPYVTVDFAGLPPMVQVNGPTTITSVNGSTAQGALTGSRFQLQLSNGMTWIVYANPAPSGLTWNASNVFSATSYTGTIRIAHAPTPGSISVLDAYAGAIPRGGTIFASTACDTAQLSFNWSVSGTGALLMNAMPHQQNRLLAASTTALTYQTLSGTLRGMVGNSWTMSLPLSTTTWSAPRAVSPARLAAVQAALNGDASYIPPATAAGNDPYFGGKYLAKLARLALIADELGATATAATLRARLSPLVAAWLDGTNGNPLVYDTTWGGIFPVSLANTQDFGQRHYNDHHFHYGYHLYAAAALIKADPSFFTSHRDGLLALVRDVANPSAADPKFTRFRNIDFFRSHSWAGGTTDPRNQESTSEAVNAWYALRLLGLATGDARMSELGRVLTALEIDGARTYWQIPNSSTIYGGAFAQNRCVGKLYDYKAMFDTFFSAQASAVYGIQIIPITPISEELFSPVWVNDAWPKMSASLAQPGAIFFDFLYGAHAVVASSTAWGEVNGLSGFDDGDSKTNALWWVGTRP